MAPQARTLMILLAVSFFVSYVQAASYWYGFWLAHPDDNLVWDIPDGQPKTNEEFENMLRSDTRHVYASRTDAIGEQGSTWWIVAFLDENVFNQKYNGLSLVRAAGIYRPSDALPENGFSGDVSSTASTASDRTATRLRRALQYDAPRHLKFVSMPKPANNDLDNEHYYSYEDSAGSGVRVYVVDEGINLESSEWTANGRPEPDWIFVGPWATGQKVDLDPEGHGTCMADLAAGAVNGVAKKSDITAVSVDLTTNDILVQLQWLLHVDALAKIVDDIADRGIGDRAVLLIALTIPRNAGPANHAAFVDVYSTLLKELDSRGVSLVVAMPNGEKCVDMWPCIFGDPNNDHHIPNLIVVGSGDINTGHYDEPEENRNDWATIYGPGADSELTDSAQPGPILCADKMGDWNSLYKSGASPATAIVAGLMAYFKGMGFSNDVARNWLKSNAYARDPDGPKMPRNGYIPH